MKEEHKKLDEILKLRQKSYFDFNKSTLDLHLMGVKVRDSLTGQILLPPEYTNYLEQFNNSLLEFEWLVEYDDGTFLAEFDGDKNNNFSHIDLKKVTKVSYISNFDWHTDNKIKRVVVTLDMKTGLFNFANGFVSQEVRGARCVKPLKGERKLILFKNKTISQAGGPVNDDKDQKVLLNEAYFYNIFVLGYEVNGEKYGVSIYPNGIVQLFG